MTVAPDEYVWRDHPEAHIVALPGDPPMLPIGNPDEGNDGAIVFFPVNGRFSEDEGNLADDEQSEDDVELEESDIGDDSSLSAHGESLEVSTVESAHGTMSSEEERVDEDEDLSPPCQFVQRIPSNFRLPWNHEKPLDHPDEEPISEDERQLIINEEDEGYDAEEESKASDISSPMAFGNFPKVSSNFPGYDTMSSEEEEVDEDKDLPPQCRFVQTIPPNFRLPWNHELQEEPPECQEDNSFRGTSPCDQESVEVDLAPSTSGSCFSRKRTREGDSEEELPAKRTSR
ncbi:hypothetical protein CHARACLAT_024337 [Characodon lateralis]|uniref:Uncharacterized protein n=1 Tax=Characodon lateralis TaxID=208331 RepID=A0ABU7E6G7_9TELE|nr:hypothetical protein [Characodon lateralis]